MSGGRIHLGDDIRELDFVIGETVYLRCRDAADRGLVTGYRVWPQSITYVVSWGKTNSDTSHHGIELSGAFEPEYVQKAED